MGKSIKGEDQLTPEALVKALENAK